MANSGDGYAYIYMNVGMGTPNSGDGYGYGYVNVMLYVINANDSMPPMIN